MIASKIYNFANCNDNNVQFRSTLKISKRNSLNTFSKISKGNRLKFRLGPQKNKIRHYETSSEKIQMKVHKI